MDKQTFQKNYGLSRGQITRILAKAAQEDGRFCLDGCGWFIVTKAGKGKTCPVDIVPDRSRQEPPATAAPIAAPETPAAPATTSKYRGDLSKLSAVELRNQKTVAEIEKIRQATERGRLAIRQEFLDELIPVLTGALSKLRAELERLRLAPDDLDRLRVTIDDAMREIDEVRHVIA